ncbi:hypothetical protein ACQXY3_02410 [Corynebacterium diphtheriae]|uniref:hypothetical protein n=1 Tax=Corynebacterium diphtheriae TaxID=1717 RepID=UPI0011D1E18E|nr:hypothetical protein [Corynebacterium diphtheriae]MDZ5308637.1 hypothetical protein [Corynebacterium diphtheriae]UJL53782.1 hypothetical protein FE380_06045 [Corynebacterium diphtheriae]
MDPIKPVPRDDDLARHQRTDPTYRRDLFLANLRAAIDADGRSFVAIARDAGIDLSIVRRLYYGDRYNPTFLTVLRLEKALGTPIIPQFPPRIGRPPTVEPAKRRPGRR